MVKFRLREMRCTRLAVSRRLRSNDLSVYLAYKRGVFYTYLGNLTQSPRTHGRLGGYLKHGERGAWGAVANVLKLTRMDKIPRFFGTAEDAVAAIS